jgi:hypothetical protein
VYRLSVDSIVQFTPDASRTWLVGYQRGDSYAYAPVIGWAVVVDYSDKDEATDTSVDAVILSDGASPQTARVFYKHEVSGSSGSNFWLEFCEPDRWAQERKSWDDGEWKKSDGAS